MASTQGALALLPLYAVEGPILLKQDPVWTQSMRAAQKNARQQRTTQALPANWPMIEKAIIRAPTQSLKWLILLTWVTCARGGCARQLAKENILLNQATGEIAVTFMRGKRASVEGAYTIHSCVPPAYVQGLAQWITRRPQGLLFPAITGAHLVAALRLSDPRLEQRSLRRGSIQTMAKSGISEERLLDFSGHKSLGMLRRYLDFGLVAPFKQQATLAARLLTTQEEG